MLKISQKRSTAGPRRVALFLDARCHGLAHAPRRRSPRLGRGARAPTEPFGRRRCCESKGGSSSGGGDDSGDSNETTSSSSSYPSSTFKVAPPLVPLRRPHPERPCLLCGLHMRLCAHGAAEARPFRRGGCAAHGREAFASRASSVGPRRARPRGPRAELGARRRRSRR